MTGDPTRYARYPEVGHFYAIREPLGLAEVVSADMGYPSLGQVTFQVWSPTGISEAVYISIKDTADFLWCNRTYDRQRLCGQALYEFDIGDVRIAVQTNRLWFVGPKTDSRHLHVLASFHVSTEEVLTSDLYQPGPKAPTQRTAFERILDDTSV